MQHPLAIIGAGPIGLAAAANAAERGLDFVVLEAGPDAGAAIGEWAHVRLFSAWRELIDPAARRLLEAAGTWTAPDEDTYPTGREWREAYLQPLADLLAASPGGSVRYGTKVVGVSRAGRDLLVDSGRETDPFAVHVQTASGHERLLASSRRRRLRHLDAAEPSGCRWLPGSGRARARRPVLLRHPRLHRPGGRRSVRRQARGRRRQGRFRPGSAHRARQARPARRRRQSRDPSVLAAAPPQRRRRLRWRRQRPARAARQARPGRQGSRQQRAGHQRHPVPHRVRHHPGRRTPHHRLGQRSAGGRRRRGHRRDRVPARLRLPLRGASRPRPGPGRPHGSSPTRSTPTTTAAAMFSRTASRSSRQPEEGLYLVGMKSYGRAPSFLAMTGFEQVRSVVAALARRPRGRLPRRPGAARDRGVQRCRRLRRPRRHRRDRWRLLRRTGRLRAGADHPGPPRSVTGQ